eukprot:g40031.t1
MVKLMIVIKPHVDHCLHTVVSRTPQMKPDRLKDERRRERAVKTLQHLLGTCCFVLFSFELAEVGKWESAGIAWAWGSKGTEVTVKKKKGRSVLPLSTINDHQSKEQLLSDCVNLANILYSKESESQSRPGSGDEIQLGLFVDRAAVYRMFEEEGQNHLEAGHSEICYQLMLWKGDVRGALEMATERGELNDALVAMAPM